MKYVYENKYNVFSWDIIKKAKAKYERDGGEALFNLGCRIIIKPLKFFYLKYILPLNWYLNEDRRFLFKGKLYKHFYSWNHFTWENDRMVEVPIAMEYVNKNKDKKILEVGSVLNQFHRFPHTIVDKYEEEEGVCQEDIIDYNPNEKYDLIVSVSTFEHIGFNEPVKDSQKVLKAIEKVKSLVAPGGKILITCPLGHTPHLDKFLQDGTIKFDEEFFLRRDSFNEWRSKWTQIDREEAFKNLKKVAPFDRVIIGVFNG